MKTAINLAIVSVLISGFVAGCKKKEPVAYKATVPTPAKATVPTPPKATPPTPPMVTDPLKPVKPTAKRRGRPTSKAPTDRPTVVKVSEADQPGREVKNSADTARPATYTIKADDTLWSIAVKHLGSGQRWKDIEEANPGLDRMKLRVEQVIKLPTK
ncbi:MAG: LysM peptidoglycan-binding domain-containing protein [Phycisphaerae bacterium]|nr:LysM peptidoglycan-binding domain-containing protein [Phycisphaerae bacterium]